MFLSTSGLIVLTVAQKGMKQLYTACLFAHAILLFFLLHLTDMFQAEFQCHWKYLIYKWEVSFDGFLIFILLYIQSFLHFFFCLSSMSHSQLSLLVLKKHYRANHSLGYIRTVKAQTSLNVGPPWLQIKRSILINIILIVCVEVLRPSQTNGSFECSQFA